LPDIVVVVVVAAVQHIGQIDDVDVIPTTMLDLIRRRDRRLLLLLLLQSAVTFACKFPAACFSQPPNQNDV
jgi:hypothetical protein